MAQLRLSRKATDAIRELPKDSVLLRRLWRHLERIADDPLAHSEPAPFPHPPDRLLAAFSVEDGQRQTWGFSVTLRVDEPETVVVVLTAHGAQAPYLDEFGEDPA